MSIISLTTDFGQADGYVGIMKGVILGISPETRLVDVSHDIAPGDIAGAAYVLARAIPYFPAGAIHLVVVDPGVGSARRPLLVQTSSALFVGPDNGVLTPALADPSAQAWQLDRPEYWLDPVGSTFHGRDVFAPCAAHLARGLHPADLARPIDDPVRLSLPAPRRLADGGVEGAVVTVDHFGNLITNIAAEWLGPGPWRCRIAGREIAGPCGSYSDVAEGAPVALIGGSGALEVAVRNGNAARALGAGPGDVVLAHPA
jgi:hypothetical protein